MNSYLRKIDAERIVLRTVNGRFPHPLHGLSSAAIEDWSQRVRVPEALVSELLEVGAEVGAMCERSGERLQQPHRARMERGHNAAIRFRSRHAS